MVEYELEAVEGNEPSHADAGSIPQVSNNADRPAKLLLDLARRYPGNLASYATRAVPQNDSSTEQLICRSADKDRTSQENNRGKPKKSKNDRMFFVMPNYYTIEDESQAGSISWKEKFSIAAKGSFDPYEFVTAGFLAGIRQAENAYRAVGQADGNIMVGAVFPTIIEGVLAGLSITGWLGKRTRVARRRLPKRVVADVLATASVAP